MINTLPKKQFQGILDSATFDKFASLKHNHSLLPGSDSVNQHIPTNEEVIAHLKILKAFQLLKIKILGKPGDIDEDGSFIDFTAKQIKFWQVYLSNAARRFIVYMSALKHKFKINYPFVDETEQLSIYMNDPNSKLISEFINSVLPPLDVLMIWHSFTLNPKSFYDNGVRNNFLEFTLCPFPLHQIAKLIDENTFIYQPLGESVKEFHDFTRDFGFAMEFDYAFDLKMKISIICPICDQLLAHGVPFTTYSNHGFADPGFKSVANGGCMCLNHPADIDHESLRMRQVHADLDSSTQLGTKYLPNIVRAESRLLNKQPLTGIAAMDSFFKSSSYLIINYLISASSWSEFINNVSFLLNISSIPNTLDILKLYEQMNLLHLTIPVSNAKCVQISEDLVSLTVRQERFIMKMNSFDLLNSKVYLNQSAEESITRYVKFFKLMSENYLTTLLVPTLDIDLIWHTHQLSPIYYIQYSRSITPRKFVIGHDDKIDEDTLSASFQTTGTLFYQRFGEHYYYCPCSFCNGTPQNTRPIVKSLFSNNDTRAEETKYLNNSTSSLLRISNSLTNTNASHISAHNAVRKITKKKKMNYKTIERPFPWNDWNAESRALNKYGSYFVLQPIGEETDTGDETSDNFGANDIIRSQANSNSDGTIINSNSSGANNEGSGTITDPNSPRFGSMSVSRSIFSSKSNSTTSMRVNSSNSLATFSSLSSAGEVDLEEFHIPDDFLNESELS